MEHRREDAADEQILRAELGVGGAFTSGTPFNVRFRVIDDLLSPTSILMSDCVTVVVK